MPIQYLSRFCTIFYISILLCCFTLPGYCRETFSLQPYKRNYLLTGFTEPQSTMVLSTEVSGKIDSIVLDVGGIVPENGELAHLDSTFVNLDLEKNTIQQRQVERQLELERKTLARYESLITQNSTAQATYDEALLQADVLLLQLSSLEKEEVILREKLKRHILKGPPGWRVVARFAEPGEYLRQGTAVLQLGNFETSVVSFLLTVQELELLENLDKIKLQLPEIKTVSPAAIFRVSPEIDEKSRKIKVDLQIDGAHGSAGWMRGGLRAKLKLEGKVEENLFVAPEEALISRYEAHWLVTPEGDQVKVNVVSRNIKQSQAVISGKTLGLRQRYLINPSL